MSEQLPEPRRVDQTPPGVPRWVKVFGIVAALVVVLVIVMLFAGHGPSRHG